MLDEKKTLTYFGTRVTDLILGFNLSLSQAGQLVVHKFFFTVFILQLLLFYKLFLRIDRWKKLRSELSIYNNKM